MLQKMPIQDAQRTHLTKHSEKMFCRRKKKALVEFFTLEHFISNKKNALPLAIAHEVALAQREPRYNPLVYYGKSGSGKTHLLRAIAGPLSKIYGAHAVFYGNMAELLQTRAQHSKEPGIDEYQAYCIDDIHLFANDEVLQEKFFTLLESCLYEKKQFVCACSGPLVSHKGFSGNLRSRLESGMTIALRNPDIDVRMRFAQTHCMLLGLDIAREHLLLLAQHCEHLSYLLGVLLRIAACKKLRQRKITKQDIERILQNSREQSPVTPQDIIRRVAEYFSLPPEEITGNKRKSVPVLARHTAMYLCREILGTSFPLLGRLFGGKDHSTIIYGIKKIEKNIITHKNVHMEITTLKNMCLPKNNEA